MEAAIYSGVAVVVIISHWLVFRLGKDEGRTEIELETHKAYQKELNEYARQKESVEQQLEFYRSRLYLDEHGVYRLRDATNDLKDTVAKKA